MSDNIHSLNDFVNNEMPDSDKILDWDGDYLEIKDKETGKYYEVVVSGNGDFTHHKAEYRELLD